MGWSIAVRIECHFVQRTIECEAINLHTVDCIYNLRVAEQFLLNNKLDEIQNELQQEPL